MTGNADEFGMALLDWVRGGTDVEVLERDDGFVDTGAGRGEDRGREHEPLSDQAGTVR